METAKSVAYFILAGLWEIGGGGPAWIWPGEGKGILYAAMGAFVLILHGVISTFQPADFGRVHAAHGGVLIVLSILWGWRKEDGVAPDRFQEYITAERPGLSPEIA